MRAAAPDYMKDMQAAAAGHRFDLYFAIWTAGERWELESDSKTKALQKVLLNEEDKKRSAALAMRQRAQAFVLADSMLSLPAISTSPFVTGMGYEHSVENGFAFLKPYGIPYLPGSSIKGVLRQAAIENDLNQEHIDTLFGTSAESDEFGQGALVFWDVYPQGDLVIEMMTPHHGKYLQGESTPHDSESPNPIPFLTIAPKAEFAFHVQCVRALDMDWRALLGECFEYAFDWLGFGAKTAVGYGVMQQDTAAAQKMALEQQRLQKQEAEKQAQMKQEAELAAMTPLDREIAEILAKGEVAASDMMKGLESGRWQGSDAKKVAEQVKKIYEGRGNWMPSFSGSNKLKKKTHDATLKVMRYLGDA